MSEVYVVVQNFLGDPTNVIGVAKSEKGAKKLAQDSFDKNCEEGENQKVALSWEANYYAYGFQCDWCGVDKDGDGVEVLYYITKTTLID
jgi:hypothetical protein